jgi:rubrerythrin
MAKLKDGGRRGGRAGKPGGAGILKIALEAEKDGLEMYLKASERTLYPLGRQMFLSLAEDEKSHIRMIHELAAGRGLQSALNEAREGTPTGRMKNALTALKSVVMDDLSVCADELEVLRIGLDMEKRSYEFYKQAATDAASADERGLCEKLAAEEGEHYKMLQNTYEYLEDRDHWFLWTEHGLLDGG